MRLFFRIQSRALQFSFHPQHLFGVANTKFKLRMCCKVSPDIEFISRLLKFFQPYQHLILRHFHQTPRHRPGVFLVCRPPVRHPENMHSEEISYLLYLAMSQGPPQQARPLSPNFIAELLMMRSIACPRITWLISWPRINAISSLLNSANSNKERVTNTNPPGNANAFGGPAC